MENETTGYKADLPENAEDAILNSINGDEYDIPVPDYTGAIYSPETAAHYGMYVWDASVAITSVIIDGENVPIQPVLNGAHPAQKPKPK